LNAARFVISVPRWAARLIRRDFCVDECREGKFATDPHASIHARP